MRSMAVAQLIGKVAAQRHLDPLDGIEHQQAQLTIKQIMIQHRLELGARVEGMAPVVCLVGEPVGGESIVVQVGQIVLGSGFIPDLHTPLAKASELIGIAEGRFLVSH